MNTKQVTCYLKRWKSVKTLGAVVGDWGQSNVQFRGDDTACKYAGMDVAIFADYFSILINYCNLKLWLKPVIVYDFGMVTESPPLPIMRMLQYQYIVVCSYA
jgi:hypothetical protein